MNNLSQTKNDTIPSPFGEGLGEGLLFLAQKYETKEFLIGDPSWFMHHIDGETNKELLAFIASSLSYGSRKQFLPKIHLILDNIVSPSTCLEGSTSVTEWLLSGHYSDIIPESDDCFYRLYTCQIYNDFLRALAEIVRDYGSLKGMLQKKMRSRDALEAIKIITQEFYERGSRGVIPKDTSSSCKRVCMFLRWMVRDNSPVDLGIWSDIIDKRTLIIPMDTHVVQESIRLGLLTSKSTSMQNARKLSARLAESFPDDPIKADFALFGLGVDA